jgi:hypothetical protein
MNKKILIEDAPPKMVGDLHMPMVLFMISVAVTIGAAIMNLILKAP